MSNDIQCDGDCGNCTKLAYCGGSDDYNLYLDYVNNFVSVAGFADHYGMPESEALELIAGQAE